MKRFQKMTAGVLYALLCVVATGCSESEQTYHITIDWGSIGYALIFFIVGGIVVFYLLMRAIFGD